MVGSHSGECVVQSVSGVSRAIRSENELEWYEDIETSQKYAMILQRDFSEYMSASG